MPYFDTNTSRYVEIKEKIMYFVYDIASFFDIQTKEVRWHHCRQYCEEKLNIKFVYIESGKEISGFAMNKNGCKIVVLNKNISNKNRMNFTTCHEITHMLLHFDKQVIPSMSEYVVYSEEYKEYEKEADIGASILMANDEVIEHMLENKYSFKDMTEALGYSDNGLSTRLINYFQHNLGCKNKLAYNVIYNYRGKDPDFCLFTYFDVCKNNYNKK